MFQPKQKLAWASKRETAKLAQELVGLWAGQPEDVVLEKALTVLDAVASGKLLTATGAHYWAGTLVKEFVASGLNIPKRDSAKAESNRLAAYA